MDSDSSLRADGAAHPAPAASSGVRKKRRTAASTSLKHQEVWAKDGKRRQEYHLRMKGAPPAQRSTNAPSSSSVDPDFDEAF